MHQFALIPRAPGEPSIHWLADEIARYLDDQWRRVLDDGRDELQRLYGRAGEGAAYGGYAHRLCRPVHDWLTAAGFQSAPSFPGRLSTSREWGAPTARERWMWSVVRSRGGQPAGTLVIKYYHDHTRFNLPRPPQILALTETETSDIEAALGRASAEFASAEP